MSVTPIRPSWTPFTEWAQLEERLFARDMARIYRMSVKRFYVYENEGAFLFAEIRPQIGKKSWSKDRVKAHFDGTLTGLTVPGRRKMAKAS